MMNGGCWPGLALVAMAAVPFGLPCASSAQQASLQGIVLSSSTGSPLEGVSVMLEREGKQIYGALTDRNGFYQIGGIQPGSYMLRSRLIGYARHEESVTLASDERGRANFRLDMQAVELEGVTVTPEMRPGVIPTPGRQVVTPADISRVPAPAGAGDLATYIKTLPGVTTTSDRGGQVYIRGGTPAENLALVDGIPIYQPFHIVDFFSVFPEDLVSTADFYAGGFGARYTSRTSSVLDVSLRDGNPHQVRGMASLSPFLVEALAEGPLATDVSILASARRSLIEMTSGTLLGQTQPYSFDSKLLKLTMVNGEYQRCSGLFLHTSDRGRLDPEETVSHIAWQNLLFGGRCVTQLSGFARLADVSFSYSGFNNDAVSRGASLFHSRIGKVEHDAHLTTLVGTVLLYGGYHLSGEVAKYDLTELFGIGRGDDAIFAADAYLESALPAGSTLEVRPGIVLDALPVTGVEPRVRASWQPFGRPSETLQGAFGVYRQNLVGTSDIRDATSAFTAWMAAPNAQPLQTTYGSLGWRQSLTQGLRLSAEGYYKWMKHIPVPVWRATAAFTTELTQADGTSYGADARLEYTVPHLYAFLGYGWSWTQYRATQAQFASWFGEPVQSYHPPQDRRHQLNAVISLDLGGFKASGRWQYGSGLPFTKPLGFDEAFNYTVDLYDVSKSYGTARVLLDRPFNGRLPLTHRLDLSLKRGFELPIGELEAQVGAINVYDRRNMFYYDIYTARRVDQLPLAPYASVVLRSR
jgi:hypothetical protein